MTQMCVCVIRGRGPSRTPLKDYIIIMDMQEHSCVRGEACFSEVGACSDRSVREAVFDAHRDAASAERGAALQEASTAPSPAARPAGPLSAREACKRDAFLSSTVR